MLYGASFASMKVFWRLTSMPFVLKCPQCNGEVDFEENRNIMFCKYCGTKILLRKEKKAEKSDLLVGRKRNAPSKTQKVYAERLQ